MTTSVPVPMGAWLSWRLDALRAAAALAVFVSHFAQLGLQWGTSDTLWALGRIGVVVFFVMSGYVIAHVGDDRRGGLAGFLQARFARLYSVFIPALVLTVVLDVAGRMLDPFLYARFPDPLQARTLWQAPFFLGFLFENAAFSLRWFSNGPMWSIAYEFWYYALFGLIVFLPRQRLWLVLPPALLLAGWKILLLAPVWLAGVALHRGRRRLQGLPFAGRLVLGAASLAALALLLGDDAHAAMLPWRALGARWAGAGFHSAFLCDWLIALPVTGLLVALLPEAPGVPPAWLAAPVRWAAGFSFSLYLYHVPLILFFRAALVYDAASAAQAAAAALAIVLLCAAAARLTEHRKHAWRRAIAALWQRVADRAPSPLRRA